LGLESWDSSIVEGVLKGRKLFQTLEFSTSKDAFSKPIQLFSKNLRFLVLLLSAIPSSFW
jgi:hypothetical protein